MNINLLMTISVEDINDKLDFEYQDADKTEFTERYIEYCDVTGDEALTYVTGIIETDEMPAAYFQNTSYEDGWLKGTRIIKLECVKSGTNIYYFEALHGYGYSVADDLTAIFAKGEI